MELQTNANGIRLVDRGQAVHEIPWPGIEWIDAFKEDLLTTDLICLAVKELGKQECWEIDEEMPGYREVVDEMAKHLPGIAAEWWRQIAFPAFATNLTRIYTRPEGSE